jgi:single-strand selective monofunctional uracil DNA glycosylase
VDSFAAITDDLLTDLAPLTFGAPVRHVYNPLVYARAPWDLYCQRYGQGPKEAIFLGLNPGPFGMAQVGVPFGEVGLARDWLGLHAPIGKPAVEHPKRPVQGFDCPRSEVSGARFWGWARDRFGMPEAFFQRFFVANWCPLVFMSESGANVTPDKLPAAERLPLEAACDRALRRTIELLKPRFLIGVGGFAEARLIEVARDLPDVRVGRILHPSPASPAANRGWAAQAERELEELGVRIPASAE